MIQVKIQKVANMILAVRGENVVNAWDEQEFTTRKLNNYIKKQQKYYNNNIVFVIEL